MEIEHRYICETCGTSYLDRRLAEACEAFELPPCPLKAGDEVKVRERYEDPQPDTVVSIRIGATDITHMAADETGDEADRLLGFYPPSGTFAPHEWLVRVTKEHKYGKDPDAWADEFDLECFMVNGQFLEIAR